MFAGDGQASAGHPAAGQGKEEPHRKDDDRVSPGEDSARASPPFAAGEVDEEEVPRLAAGAKRQQEGFAVHENRQDRRMPPGPQPRPVPSPPEIERGLQSRRVTGGTKGRRSGMQWIQVWRSHTWIW